MNLIRPLIKWLGACARWKRSPLVQRRMRAFKANRRGVFSLYILAVLFAVSLFSELIANDKPLFIWFDGESYFPVFQSYTETEFGGSFLTEADYHDPFVKDLISAQGFMVWPLIPYSYDTVIKDKGMPAPAPPDSRNWLGTDDQQRDVAARLIYGFRLSICFGLLLTLLSSVIGVAAGAVQGYFGGLTDLLLQRFIEVWISIPALFVVIILASLMIPNFWLLLGILLLFSWVSLVAVVRAEFFRARTQDYVAAAKAMGVSDGRIMRRHILPNAMIATLTLMPFVLNTAITTLTSLDFLGVGLPPPTPSLGELLRQGKANLNAPWLGITAFMAIASLLTLLIFVGEAARNAFDPRKTA